MGEKTETSATERTVKILWAVDAFHRKPKAQLRVLDAVRRLYGDKRTTIQPVAMLPVGKFDKEGSRFLESWTELQRVARKNVEQLTKGLAVPGLHSPKLVRVDSESVAEAARGLLRVAYEDDADAIAVSSHGRSGAARLLIGSFAESLVLQSPLPVFVVNPKNGAGRKIKTVFFPTDFSEASRYVYERVVRLLAPLGARIHLFHKIPFHYPGLRYPLFVMPVPTEESAKQIRARLTETARPWLEYATEMGVKAKFILDTKPGATLDALVSLAKRFGPGAAIAMASQSNRTSTVLLGSLTRQTLRLAPCPVLVIHAEQESLAKKFFEQVKQVAYAASARPVMT